MSYQYRWLAPGRVIFCYVSGSQTVEEIQASVKVLESMLDEGTPPTHYVADLRDNDAMPVMKIKDFLKLMSFVSHRNLGWIIVIDSKNRMNNYFLALVANVIRVQYQAVRTPAEALTFLATRDPTVFASLDLSTLSESLTRQPMPDNADDISQ